MHTLKLLEEKYSVLVLKESIVRGRRVKPFYITRTKDEEYAEKHELGSDSSRDYTYWTDEHGYYHNINGPAIVHPDGQIEYFLHGTQCTPADHKIYHDEWMVIRGAIKQADKDSGINTDF